MNSSAEREYAEIDFRRCAHSLILRSVSGSIENVDGLGIKNSQSLVALVRGTSPSTYEESPIDALRTVLVRASGILSSDFDVQVAGEHVDVSVFARRLLGIETVTVKDSGKRYDQLIKDIRNSSDVTHWTTEMQNNLTAGIRQKVAEVLFQMYSRLLTSSDVAAPDYVVRRTYLEQAVHGALGSEGVVGLYGLSGNGKTVIARSVLQMLSEGGNDVAIIRGNLNDPRSPFFALDVHVAVAQIGFQNESWSLEQDLMMLMQMIRTPNAYSCVLLDNVEESTARLLALSSRVPVLLTSRERLKLDGVTSIAVSAMERRQAMELLSNRSGLPADDQKVDRLCAHLGDRPLPLALTGRIIAQGIQTPETMLELLAANTPRTVDAVEAIVQEGASPATIQVYQTIIDHCRKKARLSRCIDVLAWMAGASGLQYFTEAARGAKGQVLSEIELDAALAWLEDIGLIEQSDNAIDCNTLSLRVLRELTLDRADDLIREVYSRTLTRGFSEARSAFDSGGALKRLDRPALEGASHFDVKYQQAYADEFARRFVRPNHNYGMFALSEYDWILWQYDNHSRESSGSEPVLSCALVAVDETGIYVWHVGGSYRPSDHELEMIYRAARHYRDQSFEALRWLYGPDRVLEIDAEERAAEAERERLAALGGMPPVPGIPRTLMWFPLDLTQLGTKPKHKLLSGFHRPQLWALNSPTWTMCGQLVLPQDQGASPGRVDCPVCISDMGEQEEWRKKNIRRGVREIISATDDGTPWLTMAMLHDVGELVSLTAEEQAEHAEKGVFCALNADEPRALADAYAVRFGWAVIKGRLILNLDSLADLGEIAMEWWRTMIERRGHGIESLAWVYWTRVALTWQALGWPDRAASALRHAQVDLAGELTEAATWEISRAQKLITSDSD